METLYIEDYNRDFGVYAVINTSECKRWCGEDKPLISIVRQPADFMNLGLEVATDGRPFTDLKIGENVADTEFGGEYEGVYVMRLG